MEIVACPFCGHDPARAFIAESPWAFALYDLFPVSPGHALIIPKKHISGFFDLDEQHQIACLRLLNRVREIVAERHKPDGFNVGINAGEAAGQTIGHVHIHLIPRYLGDVAEARGGVRGVIPHKRDYP